MTMIVSNRMDRERQQRASVAGQLEWRMQRLRGDARGEQAAFDSALLNARQGRVKSSNGKSDDADSGRLRESTQANALLDPSQLPASTSTHCKEITSSTSIIGDAIGDNTPLNGANSVMPGLGTGHEAALQRRGELPQESAVNPARLQGPLNEERPSGHWQFELTDRNLPVRALAVERAHKGGFHVVLQVRDQAGGNCMQAPLLTLQHRLAGYGATLATEDETATPR
jgi:hypothetical protein